MRLFPPRSPSSTPARAGGVVVTLALVAGVLGAVQAAPAAAADLTSDLLVHYDLTQSGGTTVADTSGAGHDGTLVGSGTWTGAEGLRLDGSSAYVDLPDDLLAGLSAVTVSTQVLVDPAQRAPYFVWGLGNPATSNSGSGYLFLSGDALRAGITTTNWQGEKVTGTSGNVRRGVWTTLTYTQSGTTGTLYQDGRRVAQNTAVTVLPSAVGAGRTSGDFLGRSNYAADNLLRGNVKDFRMYGRALSPADVAALAPTPAQRVADDAAALDLGDTSAVTTDLTLPGTGRWGSTVTWSSSDPAVVSDAGVVTRAATTRTVTLTATVAVDGADTTRRFDVTVPAQLTADERAQAAVDAVVVPDLDDVRGYLTLPTTGEGGASIAWTSSDDATVSPTGVVHRPAPGGTARTVQLTATATVDGASASRLLTATVPPLPAPEPMGGYLFTYFEGNTLDGEKIYMAGSNGNNALSWSPLNGNKPVLTSTMDTKGLRDPFVLRSPEGDKFYLLATDLSIGSGTSWGDASSRGSLYLEVFESDDLIHWSAQRHILVGPADAGDAWAPEASWSPELGQYVIYWAANVTRNGQTYHRTYISTTRDFVTVTPPRLWDDPGSSVIDTTVLEDDGAYYRFTKDEGHVSGCADILQEKNTDLLAVRNDPDPSQATGPAWQTQASCIGRDAGTGGVEGPTAFKANPGDTSGFGYYLFVDEYGGRGFLPLGTDDLDDPHWTMPASYQLPAYPRHGTVLPVTAAELAALQQAAPPVTANADGVVLDYPMTQGSGTTVTDVSGNGHDATLQGAASWTGSSLALDGGSGYVRLPENVTAGLSAVTVSTDVRIDPGQRTPYFIWGMGNTDASGKGDGYLFTTGDSYRASISDGNWTREQTAGSGSNLPRGTWNTLTYTLAGGTATLYLNGSQVAQRTGVTVTPAQIAAGHTSANYIGRSVYTDDNLLQGQVRNFRLYNRALTPAQVAGLADPTLVVGSTSPALKVPAIVTAAQNRVVLPVRPDTDLSSFDAALTVADGARLDESGPQDYRRPRTVVVTAPDGSTRNWTVEVHPVRTPVLPGLYADPNIAVFDGVYYLYATTDGYAGWGGKDFYAWKSTDLAHWTRSDKPFLTLDGANGNVPWSDGNAWAPTIIERGGKYYFYFSGNDPALGRKTIGVAVADSPEGPFTASSTPMITNGESVNTGQAIDPAAFQDPATGRYYLFWGNGSPLHAELSDDMTSIVPGSITAIAGLDDFREGSFVNYRKGTYYLTYSIDDTGSPDYRVGYATASSVDGPWTYRGVILQKDPSLGILATGHSSIVQVPGTDDWYIAYHRFAIPGGDGQHRETTIDRLTFNDDGTIAPVHPTLEGPDPLVSNAGLPTATISEPGDKGWFRAGAHLTLTAGGDTSALRYRFADGDWTAYTAPVALTSAAGRVEFQARGTNLLWGPVRAVWAKVDTAAPTASATTDPAAPDGSNGWFRRSVTVTFSAVDDRSGVRAVQYRLGDGGWTTVTGPVTVPEGTTRVAVRAYDRAGNVSAARWFPVRRDGVAPVTSPTVTTGPGSATVTLAATDATSGVRTVSYRVDGGAWQTATAPVVLGVGSHVVAFTARDTAGNVEAVRTVRVRVLAPRA